jgi:hypothetical protein
LLALVKTLRRKVVSGRVVVPPITRVQRDDVPGLYANTRADGKTVITL